MFVKVSPGKMVVTFTPTEPGEHNINLTLDDQQIPNTPICLTIRPKPNAGKVSVNGDGVREGEVGKPSVFSVDTSKAGPGNLDVKINGPEDPLSCNVVEVGDGLYEVTYVPKEEGPHVVAVKFADQHVPGSAFSVYVSDVRSEPITYQLPTEPSEPAPLVHWPNTYLKKSESSSSSSKSSSSSSEKGLAPVPEQPSSSTKSSSSSSSKSSLSNHSIKNDDEAFFKSTPPRSPTPKIASSSDSSTTSLRAKIEQEKQERRKKFEAQWGNILSTIPPLSDDEPAAKDQPKPNDKDQNSNSLSEDSFGYSRPHKKNPEKAPYQKPESESESSTKSSLVENEETATFYKIHSAPLPPRSPSTTSTNESETSDEYIPKPENLAERIRRRKQLDEEWNNRYSFDRKKDLDSPEPIVYRESTLEDHKKNKQPELPDTQDKSSSSHSNDSNNHGSSSETSATTVVEETFQDKLQFFRRASVSNPSPSFPQSYNGYETRNEKRSPEPSPKLSSKPSKPRKDRVDPPKRETSSDSNSENENETILKSILSSISVSKSPVKQAPNPSKSTKCIGVQCELLKPPRSMNSSSSSSSRNTKKYYNEKPKEAKTKKAKKYDEPKKPVNEIRRDDKKPKKYSGPKDDGRKKNLKPTRSKSSSSSSTSESPKKDDHKTPKNTKTKKSEQDHEKNKPSTERKDENKKHPSPKETRNPLEPPEIDWVYTPRRYSTLEKPEKRWNLSLLEGSESKDDNSVSLASETRSKSKNSQSDVKPGKTSSVNDSSAESSGFKIPEFSIRKPEFKFGSLLSKSESEADTKDSTNSKSSESSNSTPSPTPEDPTPKRDSIFDFSFKGILGERDDKDTSKESKKPSPSPSSTSASPSTEKESSTPEEHPFFSTDYFNLKKPDFSNFISNNKDDDFKQSEAKRSSSASSSSSSSHSIPTPKPVHFRRSVSLDRRSSVFNSEYERQMYLREIRNRPKVYNEDIKNSKTRYEYEIGRSGETLDRDSAKWHDLTASERARLMNKQLRKGEILDTAREKQRERRRSKGYYRNTDIHSDEETRTSTRRSSIVDDRIALYRSLSGATENFQYNTLPTKFAGNTKYSEDKPQTAKKVNAPSKSTPIIRGGNDNYFIFKPTNKNSEEAYRKTEGKDDTKRRSLERQRKPSPKPIRRNDHTRKSSEPKRNSSPKPLIRRDDHTRKSPEPKRNSSPKPLRRDEPVRNPPEHEKRSTWGHEWARKHNLLVSSDNSSRSSESTSDHRARKENPVVIVDSRRPNRLLERKTQKQKSPEPTVKREKKKPLQPAKPKKAKPKPRKVSSSSSSSDSSSYSYSTSDSSVVYRTAKPTVKKAKAKPEPKMAAVPEKSQMNTVPPPPREIQDYSSQSTSYSVPTSQRRRKISADDSWIRDEFIEKDESVTYYQDLPEDFQPWNRRR